MFVLYRADLDVETIAASAGVADLRAAVFDRDVFVSPTALVTRGYAPCGFIGDVGAQCPHGDLCRDIATDVAQLGWIVLDESVGVDFITPIIELVNDEIDRRIAAGVVIDGLLFKASESDETRTLKLAQNAALAFMGVPVLAFPMQVPSDTFIDGIQQMLTLDTAAEAIQFAGALLMNSEAERESARPVKDQIRQAATEPEARAIFDAWRLA